MADAPFGARSRGCFYCSRALRLKLAVSDEAVGRSRVVQVVFIAVCQHGGVAESETSAVRLLGTWKGRWGRIGPSIG
jgi:hypothetical protein